MTRFNEHSQTGKRPPTLISRLMLRAKRRLRDQRYQALRDRGWYSLHWRSDADAIFVGGCGRSGTTLVQEMLNRHRRIACGPETSMFGLQFNVSNIASVWQIPKEELESVADSKKHLVQFADWFYPKYLLEPSGKARWADKTPNNVRVVSDLLTWYPKGVFIHVIRDGRDVVCSLRTHPKERVVDGKIVPVVSNNPIERCAARWLSDVSAGRAFQGHPRYFELRYERLIESPERELGRLCEFLGEEYDPCMLDPQSSDGSMEKGRLVNNQNAGAPISGKSLGRWCRDLSGQEQKAVDNIIGELLIATRYADNHDWVDQSSVSETSA